MSVMRVTFHVYHVYFSIKKIQHSTFTKQLKQFSDVIILNNIMTSYHHHQNTGGFPLIVFLWLNERISLSNRCLHGYFFSIPNKKQQSKKLEAKLFHSIFIWNTRFFVVYEVIINGNDREQILIVVYNFEHICWISIKRFMENNQITFLVVDWRLIFV